MASLYSTKVTASGGRHGSIRSDDGLLDLKLALLGGRGDATNPEQPFAGGYAVCFENTLLRVSRDAGHHLADADIKQISPYRAVGVCLAGCVEAGVSAFFKRGPGRALNEMATSAYPDIPARSLEGFRMLHGASVAGLRRQVSFKRDA
jgi:hypothetical protein